LFEGVKPLRKVTASVPSSVAAPVTFRRSYSAQGFVPAISTASVPAAPCA
jgi:hypothetical protein